MAATTMVHVRVDEKTKAQAAETLASMGLSISDAVRVFLTRVVADRQLPFALKAPNAVTLGAMSEADRMVHVRRARFATSATGSGGVSARKKPPPPAPQSFAP